MEAIITILFIFLVGIWVIKTTPYTYYTVVYDKLNNTFRVIKCTEKGEYMIYVTDSKKLVKKRIETLQDIYTVKVTFNWDDL